MPGCRVKREERGGRAIYTLAGKLDGASAWELRRQLEQERAAEVLLDFSQVADFADYGVAVLAQALDRPRRLQLTGVRQHTLRLLKYFGVDLDRERAPMSASAPAAYSVQRVPTSGF